jgi:Flp pilus assembly protein TadB
MAEPVTIRRAPAALRPGPYDNRRGKGTAAWLAASFALILGGIAFVIAPTNLIGLAMLLAGAVSLVGGPFALVVREGRRSQRAKQDALAQFPDSRALDPLRGRRIMGGSPELFREIALRERLEQTGVPGSARILSVTPVE